MTNFHSGKNYSILIYLFLILSGCEIKKSELEDRFKKNMASAGKNREELKKVIARYQKNPGDSLKLKAAIFLIGNLETNIHFEGEWLREFDKIFTVTASLDHAGIRKVKDSIVGVLGEMNWAKIDIKEDLKVLSADYLIENIDQAYDSWQHAPWSSSVSFDAFCNYILPYNSFSEYPENWRNLLRERYQYILEDPDIPKTMEDVCCAIVDDERTWFRWTGEIANYPSPYPAAISISNLLKGQRGACVDMANLAAYSARALGIPVAMDYVHRWGNGGAHGWSALILTDSTFLPFLGAERRPGDYESIREGEFKPAKVVRHTLSYNESSFAARARMAGLNEIPQQLSDPRNLDVTSYYNTTADITLDIQGKNRTPVYLCVFRGDRWDAIDGGLIEDNKVVFKQMGRDLVYLPMYFKNYDYHPAAPPILLPIKEGKKELIPDMKEKITMKLIRKSPLKKENARILERNLNGARFEGSNSQDFKNPTVLYLASKSKNINYKPEFINGYTVRDRLNYESLWEQAEIDINKSCRFVRMKIDAGKDFKLGELLFYSADTSLPLSGKPLGTIPDPARAFDGLPGNSIIHSDKEKTGLWAGLDLGQSVRIAKIRYLPANDDHSIEPDKTYELFYWKDKWISLGVQKGDRHYLEYKEVPGGGLYWVLCKDCKNKYARPFTYEENRQVWW